MHGFRCGCELQYKLLILLGFRRLRTQKHCCWSTPLPWLCCWRRRGPQLHVIVARGAADIVNLTFGSNHILNPMSARPVANGKGMG